MAFRCSGKLPNIRHLGSLFSFGASSQRISTRFWQGEYFEGTKYRRYDISLALYIFSDHGKFIWLSYLLSTEGELVDLIDEFSDGKIQFAFVKVKDQNTALPKSVLVAWVGQEHLSKSNDSCSRISIFIVRRRSARKDQRLFHKPSSGSFQDSTCKQAHLTP